MIANLSQWLARIWPQRRLAVQVLQEYAGLRTTSPLVLQDIALRGGVWTTSHVANDPYASAYNEGRRTLALEIIKLSGQSADELLSQLPPLMERKTHA